MTDSRPLLWFYVPSEGLVRDVPASIRDYWSWVDGAVKQAPAMLASGRGPCTWLGPYNWTIQTFLYLREAGVPCTLTASLPDAGIVFAHGDFLTRAMQALPRQFLVEIKPDRYLNCRHANFVIVQNRHDPIRSGWPRALVPSAFVNYWPQPGLVPRDPSRDDRFENVCFMGNREQFLADLAGVEAAVTGLGLTWRMPSRERWHDYSEVDAIVAVRPLDDLASRPVASVSSFTPNRKPASKLYNAWLAGVPAILSPEVAFEDLRRSELDYIEARTVPDVAEALRRLQADPALRRAMRENARRRAGEFTVTQIVNSWRSLIERRIVPAYNRWARLPLQRRWLEISRQILERKCPAV
jgi:hypothetical protein